MFNPSVLNSRFKLFQWKSKRFSGLNYSDKLPLNMFFCQSFTNFYLSIRHVDLIIWYLKRKLKKSGTLVFVTPTIYPITKKPTEVRMGKGKGGITDWAIPSKIGSIPFQFQGQKTITVKTSLSDVLKKLPIWSKIAESKHQFTQLNKTIVYFNNWKITKYSAIIKRITS